MEFVNKRYNLIKLFLIFLFIICYTFVNRYKFEHSGATSIIIKTDMITGRSYYSNGVYDWKEMK